MTVIEDAALARRLLERATGHQSKPALSTEEIDDLLAIAETVGTDGSVSYPGSALNRAAAVGWNWKANMLAEQYDLGGGGGKTLTRSQWRDYCRQRAIDYSTGEASVAGADRAGAVGLTGWIGSVGTVSSTATYAARRVLMTDRTLADEIADAFADARPAFADAFHADRYEVLRVARTGEGVAWEEQEPVVVETGRCGLNNGNDLSAFGRTQIGADVYATVSPYTVELPAGTTLTEHDRIRINGREYLVDDVKRGGAQDLFPVAGLQEVRP